MTLDVREFIERGQPGLHFPGLNIFEHGQSYPLHQAPSFEAFIRGSSSRCIAEFFRSVLDELEGHRGLLEYHMKVMDDHQAGWCVRVWYGGENEQSKSGPIDAPMCMSCEMDCPLSVGVGAGVTTLTTRDTALGEFEFHRAWIDAKARPLLVLTPKRHVRRLSELSDDELVAFWRDAVDMIELEQIPRFNSLILNHGKFQNHAHLHLKIRIPPKDFYNAVSRWPAHQQAMFRRVEAWAKTLPYESQGRGPPRHGRTNIENRQAGLPAPCQHYARGQCRFGHQCRFSHH
mmetsp:Transcript_8057/g.15276  ORF Transcript_8057/g.15276 Transcript_8057/m.15276 type:complete len:288 (+) Transcript_8057:226-1089(+)